MLAVYLGSENRLFWFACASGFLFLKWVSQSRLTAKELTWDWSRPSECGQQLCSWSICGDPSSATRICSWRMSWLFGTYLLWCIAQPWYSEYLVQPQLDVPCIVNSNGTPYHFWGMDGWWKKKGGSRKWEERRKEKLGLVCKIKTIN